MTTSTSNPKLSPTQARKITRLVRQLVEASVVAAFAGTHSVEAATELRHEEAVAARIFKKYLSSITGT